MYSRTKFSGEDNTAATISKGLRKTTFRSDLNFERRFISEHLDTIKQKLEAHQLFLIDGYFPFYDIVMVSKDGSLQTIEVKIDRMCSSTKNLAIETECSEKPSGLSISKADYYLFFAYRASTVTSMPSDDKIDAYLIPTTTLKEMLSQNDYRVVMGGDNKRARLTLLPIQELTPSWTCHD